MTPREKLRAHALEALRRLIPPAHYLLRPHSLQADAELAALARAAPEDLTAREAAAADALHWSTRYEQRFREVFARACPARDATDTTDPPGMTQDEQRELWTLRECLRQSARSFALDVGDAALAGAFDTPEAPPGAASVDEMARRDASWREVFERLHKVKPRGALAAAARQLGVRRQTLADALARERKRRSGIGDMAASLTKPKGRP